MKKNFLFLILLIFSLKSFSQEQLFQIGLKTGIGLSTIYGGQDFKDNLAPNKVSHSLINGISLVSQPVSILTIQADILYSSRKYSRSFEAMFEDSTTQNLSSTNSFNYLSFSILPGIKTKGKTSFIFNAGPTFNFLTSRSYYIKTNEYEYHTNHEKVAFGSKNTFDLGLTIEAGVQQKILNFLDFKAGIRNETSIINNVPHYNFDPLKFNTTNFYIGLLYVFDFNKILEKE